MLKGIIGKLERRKNLALEPHTSSRRLDDLDVYRYRRQRGVNLGQHHLSPHSIIMLIQPY